ncbi:DUF5677 domain-containing protein [Jannaschia sp. 2305UL9-9]|uniref:DUF5677 domain-containing protein n=1 Tax=Jannaschia sp. 2305UL9-9 TaxID=3121638 RepID=UPI003529CA40
MKKKKSSAVLGNHVRKRRKLVPPFLAAMGDTYSPFSWARDISPEAIWISLLVQRYGLKGGASLVASLCNLAERTVPDDATPSFCRFSAFLELTIDQKEKIVAQLSFSEASKIKRALYPLHRVCPSHPLAFLFEEGDQALLEKEVHPNINSQLKALYDRFSRESVLSAAVATYTAISQGRLMMPRELLDKTIADLEAIDAYPNTEASKSAAGGFRAGAPANFGQFGYEGAPSTHDEWLNIFWREIGMIGSCVNRYGFEYEDVSDDPFDQLVTGLRNKAKKELSDRLDAWKPDLADIEPHEVIGALLARQVVITLEIANAPAIWTPNTAPTILRSMGDVFITLAWISGDAPTRSKQFIEHGLGAVKLEIAHREKAIEEEPDKHDADELAEMVKMQKAWLDAQRMDQFIEVNLGNWAGSNTRRMAEEAGCLDFYNYVYQPFSNAVHSSWAHVGQFNATFCNNPSHRQHWIGTLAEFEPDPHWLYLATKYLDKTFRKFDEFSGVSVTSDRALDHIVDALNSLYSDERTGE